MKKIVLLITAIIICIGADQGTFAQFSENNLAILVAATVTNNTTVSVVEINKTTTGQTAIQTIDIAGTGANPIRVSGSATSTLYAANSNDGTLFCFTGHNSDVTGSNANTILPRAVVTLNNVGTITLQTTYTGVSGQQTRCATTLNNTDWFIGDQSGIYTNNGTAPGNAANVRGVKAFGGTVYFQSTLAGIIGTIPAPGGTITMLPFDTIPSSTNLQDFYFVSSGGNDTFDILYLLYTTSIVKYSLQTGTWTKNGTYADLGGFGLAAEKSGSGTNLFISTGNGAASGNSVIKLFDAAGLNIAIDITTANNLTLYTTATGTTIKGVAFAPKIPLVSSISVNAVNGAPFCVTSTTGANGTVDYTASGNYSSATFTVILSDASGDFSSATNIGSASVSGTNPTGTINITIAAATVSGTGYKVRIDCNSPSVTGSASSAFEIINGVNNPSNVSTEGLNQSAAVSWSNPASCYNEIMIVAKVGSSIAAAPSGDGSAYNANLVFGSGTSFDGTGFVVYKGVSSPQTITNLVNGTVYYIKLFTRNGTTWSDGIEVSVTPSVPVAIAALIIPQFIQGLNGTNNNRIPFVYRAKIDNLLPSTTYKYINQIINYADGPTTNGAGNCVFLNSDYSLLRTTSPSFTTTAHGEFTTNAQGSYTGWFINEPTGNARFTPGSYVSMRIRLNNGAGGTVAETYLTISDSVKVIDFGTANDPNQGTGIYGYSFALPKDFVFIFDNVEGSGRPIGGGIVESDGINLSTVTSIVQFYRDSVDNIDGAWGTIIPNQLPNGIRRIERRLIEDGSVYQSIATDADGIWPSGANTVNPLGGLTAIKIDKLDAPIPVELTSFIASVANGKVTLTWTTATETNNKGFEVQRKESGEFQKIAFVEGNGTTVSISDYSFVDSKVSGKVEYRLKQVDFDGSFSYSNTVEVEIEIPVEFNLSQNYPNPFNPTTVIKYQLPVDGFVSLKVFNILGNEVKTLVNEFKSAGSYNVEFNGKELSSGLYIYKLVTETFNSTRKMMLLK